MRDSNNHKLSRKEVARALKDIEHGTPVEACEGAKALMFLKQDFITKELARILQSGITRHSREMAAHALHWSADPKAAASLFECASNPQEHDEVRGEALEGLGKVLEGRSALRRKAEELMIELLNSPSAALRFWACFALGELDCKRALPRLRKLKRNDKELYKGWWYVWEEAEDAVLKIAGRSPKDRVAVHLRGKEGRMG